MSSRNKTAQARLADQENDYVSLGMKPAPVEQWEDGIRTTGVPGEFEWWYFDTKLEDGSALVMVFYTTSTTSMKPGFHPYVTLDLTRPDGSIIRDKVEADISDCAFSRKRCAVKIGKSFFEGNLNRYTIRYRSERIEADILLESNVNPWRPGAGHILFGKKKYFAWLPAVPEGAVTATLRTIGRTETLTGTGYHDHNWGNALMLTLMHHWYWGRAKVGDYQIISCYITAQEKYGYTHFPIFMLAKGRELIGEDTQFVTFHQLEPDYDPVSKKHYHRTLVYDYKDGSNHYRITYRSEGFLEQSDLTGGNPLIRTALRTMKLELAYNRFSGTVTLERFDGDTVIETAEGPALWELVYFGLDRDV